MGVFSEIGKSVLNWEKKTKAAYVGIQNIKQCLYHICRLTVHQRGVGGGVVGWGSWGVSKEGVEESLSFFGILAARGSAQLFAFGAILSLESPYQRCMNKSSQPLRNQTQSSFRENKNKKKTSARGPPSHLISVEQWKRYCDASCNVQSCQATQGDSRCPSPLDDLYLGETRKTSKPHPGSPAPTARSWSLQACLTLQGHKYLIKNFQN